MARPSLDDIFSTPAVAASARPSLDDIFSSKVNTAPESIATKGIGYIAQHPFNTQFQPLAKTITGKSLEDMAREHVLSEPFTRPPADAPFDRNLSLLHHKAGLEVGAAQNADLVSSPINIFAGPITKTGGALIDSGVNAMKGAPKLAGDMAARINNNIVRLPTKAYSYSKDPLDIFKKENIVANSITDYADKSQKLLEYRTNELNDAVKNSAKSVDVADVMDKHIVDATKSAKGSLQDRTAILDKLDFMKKALTDKYGDLSKLSVQDAVKLKRQLADDFPFSGNSEENIMAKTAHKMYHDINKTIETAHPEIADLNHRVSGLIDISKAAQNRMAVESRNNPVGLIGTILGTTVGAHFGGIAGGAEGLGAALTLKAISSPAVMTRVAKILSMMSGEGRAAVAKAYPAIQKAAPQLFLEHNPAPIPSYLQQRQMMPNNIQIPTGTAQSSNPIIMNGPNVNKPLALPAPLPKYLQERQNIPPMNFPRGSAVSENPILAGGTKPNVPLALPKPTPQYLLDRQNIPAIKNPIGEAKFTPPNVIEMGPNKNEVLNNPVADFNPIKKQANGVKSKVGLSVAGGAAVAGNSSPSEASTIGQKNNNPINLKAFQKWDGMTGKDSFGHAQFKDLDSGIRASLKNLNNHKAKNPSQSISSYMSTFAEKNSDKEAAYIAQAMGISPKTTLSHVDMNKFLIHLANFESKTKLTDADIQRVQKKFNLK